MEHKPAPPWTHPRKDDPPKQSKHGFLAGTRDIIKSHAVITGLISGSLVAVLTVGAQTIIDNRRQDEADRRENLRFVRELSTANVTERPYSDMDLKKQNISGLDLSQANLQGANLDGTTAVSANLSGANLTGVRARNALLPSSNLKNSKLIWADLSGANLQSANLDGAVMAQVNLSGAILSNTNLQKADFRGDTLEDPGAHGVPVYDGAPDVCYDDKTVWPAGFVPPETDIEFCNYLFPK